jgi:hypothetical protein
MSGPLPRVLSKYLPRRYAATMIDRGELTFSTLAWFQNYEDDQRGDRFEGTRKYFPLGGLDVTRTERDGKPHQPISFKAATESLQSRATAHTQIFIYSTSLQPGLAFDGADACVEIGDPVKFAARLLSALKTHRSTSRRSTQSPIGRSSPLEATETGRQPRSRHRDCRASCLKSTAW